MTNPLEDYKTDDVVVEEDLDVKRESLAILTNIGETEMYLGVNLSLKDVDKLTEKKVEKYYNRYQAVLGRKVTGTLVDEGLKMFSNLTSLLLPIDDVEALSSDLSNNEAVKRELGVLAGLLILKGGRFVAIASVVFEVVKHIKFTEKVSQQSLENAFGEPN